VCTILCFSSYLIPSGAEKGTVQLLGVLFGSLTLLDLLLQTIRLRAAGLQPCLVLATSRLCLLQ